MKAEGGSGSSSRRVIQQAHERAQVAIFLDWFNCRYRADFRVFAEPDPPEAMVRSRRTTRWVEISTAFMSDAFAHDEYSYATPGETHKPVPDGIHIEPDREFAKRFVAVVKKKLEKKSYVPVAREYGRGYLVVPIMYPLFNAHSLRYMAKAWSEVEVFDLGCFRSVYITRRSWSDTVVQRWSEYAATSKPVIAETEPQDPAR